MRSHLQPCIRLANMVWLCMWLADVPPRSLQHRSSWVALQALPLGAWLPAQTFALLLGKDSAVTKADPPVLRVLVHCQKPEPWSPLQIFSKSPASNTMLKFSAAHFPCGEGRGCYCVGPC